MDLFRYFETDDGSLPEIEVDFNSKESLHRAFAHLFDLGAENVTVNGSYLWMRLESREMPFSGPEDAELVTGGLSDSFHVVLDSINVGGNKLPTLGVFVDPSSLVIDYRMGPHWTRQSIGALLNLLKSFIKLGGSVSVVKQWGSSGQEDFNRHLGGGA